MAKRLSYDIGFYTLDQVEKLMALFNEGKNHSGITLSCDTDVPDQNNLIITIESNKYNSKLEMLEMFSSILAVELLDRI